MKLRSLLGSNRNWPVPCWNQNLSVPNLFGIAGTAILRITSGFWLLGWEFWLQLRLWLSIPVPVLALPPNKVKLFYSVMFNFFQKDLFHELRNKEEMN